MKPYKPLFKESYLHINNGGITTECYRDPDNDSFHFKISQEHFGAASSQIDVKTDHIGLARIALDILEFLDKEGVTLDPVGVIAGDPIGDQLKKLIPRSYRIHSDYSVERLD